MVTTSMWHLTPLRPTGTEAMLVPKTLLLGSGHIDAASLRRCVAFVTHFYVDCSEKNQISEVTAMVAVPTWTGSRFCTSSQAISHTRRLANQRYAGSQGERTIPLLRRDVTIASARQLEEP
jgi:hypothetical protein